MKKKTKIKIIIVKSSEGAAAVKIRTVEGKTVGSEPLDVSHASALVKSMQLKQESKVTAFGQTKYTYS